MVRAYEEGKGGERERETWMVWAYEEGKGGERDSKTILPKEHQPSLRLITPGEILSDSVSKFGILG